MSKLEDMPIEKASEVIERFGGIRPMAKKIDVAVTTIQGWKKRDVIPAARAGDVLKAAATYGVDLSDLVTGAPTPQTSVHQNISTAALAESKSTLSDEKPDLNLEIPRTLDAPQPEVITARNTAGSETTRSPGISWLNVILIIVAMSALAALFWPRGTSNNLNEQERLAALEKNVEEIQEKQSFFGTLIPENLDQQIETLKEQAGAAKATIGQAVETAEAISKDVLAEDAGTLEQRILKLQDHLAVIASSPELQSMAARLQEWGLQPGGQAQMNAATEELNMVLSTVGDSLGSSGAFEIALESARTQNPALKQTFEGVPQSDLKAAALLLAFSQFRSSVGRDNEAFADDLQVLSKLVGEDDPALAESLQKLAPYSEQGILTPEGLTQEFKTVTGDVVMASLKGEDVSFSERAKARMNEVLQVEKNGELVSGTETQAKMKQAEDLLNAGDLEGAIAQIQTLQGPAAEAAAPWLDKAQATLMAQQAVAMIERLKSGANGLALPGTPQRIYNEESGINVLKPNIVPKAIKMPHYEDTY